MGLSVLVIVLLASSLFMAIAIGANDIANAVGTSIGAGAMRPRRAFILGSVFIMIGAVALGARTSETVGKGILTSGQLTLEGAIIGLIAGGIVALVLTLLEMPTSTTHAIIGGVMGYAVTSADWGAVRWIDVGRIASSWVISPIAGGIAAYLLYRLVRSLYLDRIKTLDAKDRAEKVFEVLMIVAAAFSAFSMGANDTSHAVGVLFTITDTLPAVLHPRDLGIPFLTAMWPILLFGGLGLCLGTFIFGERVSKTVGKGLTQLSPSMGFSAQFMTAMVVVVFAWFKVPVSTSHTLVGSVVGVGLISGMGGINKAVAREIALCWVSTLPAAFLLAAVLTYAWGWLF